MAAPEGNKFWMLRTKDGRDKIFKDPDSLEAYCFEALEKMSSFTHDEQNWVGKNGTEVIKHHQRPWSIEMLCYYLGINRETWRNYGTDEKYKDFFGVVSRINDLIHAQNFELAATGFFNPNIIAMKLGLKAKNETELTMPQGVNINFVKKDKQ